MDRKHDLYYQIPLLSMAGQNWDDKNIPLMNTNEDWLQSLSV